MVKNRTWTSLLFVGLIVMGATSLAACGGGGGSVIRPSVDPIDPVNPPTSAYSVGPYAINGIERIPQSMVKLTREEMQRKFVIVDASESHAWKVGLVMCDSYIQSGDCDSQAGKFINADGTIRTEKGSSPYTKIVSPPRSDTNVLAVREVAKMPEVKIVNFSHGGNDAASHIGDSYLAVHGTGNGSGNLPWYDDLVSPEDKVRIAAAIREDRLIYVSGWDRDANGIYVRHEFSDSCRGDDIQEGCIWTRFHLDARGGGTSYSTPHFAAALASVLAIAPDTTPQNLARFGKACVKKTGEGIEELLRVSGGLGVADFACVGDVVTAMANLPAGGTTNVTVNGQPVTLSGREIVLSFAGGSVDISEGADGLFFSTVPNGGEAVLFVTGYREGDLFAFFTAGTRDDFFGFRKEHRQVRQSGVTAGHENQGNRI